MTTATPPTDKQWMLDALGQLPDAASVDQLLEDLAILAAIRQGEAAVEAGRTVPHEEVVRMSAAWITR